MKLIKIRMSDGKDVEYLAKDYEIDGEWLSIALDDSITLINTAFIIAFNVK